MTYIVRRRLSITKLSEKLNNNDFNYQEALDEFLKKTITSQNYPMNKMNTVTTQ